MCPDQIPESGFAAQRGNGAFLQAVLEADDDRFALAELDVSGAKTLVDNSLPRCQLFHGASLVEYILKKVFIARDNLKGDVIAAGESGPFFPKVVAEKSVNGS